MYVIALKDYSTRDCEHGVLGGAAAAAAAAHADESFGETGDLCGG